jgi:hypothetical protein
MLFTNTGASLPVSMQCQGWVHGFIFFIIKSHSKLNININSALTDMKNHPVFTLHPQGEQASFSAFIPTKSGPG